MKHKLMTVAALMTLVISLLACTFSVGTQTPGTNPTDTPASGSPTSQGAPQWGVQSKTSGCKAINDSKQPDPACTPGDIFPDATKAKICVSGYSTSVRDVPESEKQDVYAEYGIKTHTSGQYEVDHFVSLELGGSNDISNLWPEPASPNPGFHEKDKVENYLHDQVCSGAMTLKDAQIQIATNWLEVYNSISK